MASRARSCLLGSIPVLRKRLAIKSRSPWFSSRDTKREGTLYLGPRIFRGRPALAMRPILNENKRLDNIRYFCIFNTKIRRWNSHAPRP